MSKIVDRIKEIVAEGFEIYPIIGTVTEVNTEESTCIVEPISGDAEILDVRLQATAAKGLKVIPKIQSTVIVVMLNNHNGFVALTSEVERIELDATQVVINQGQNSMVKGDTLKKELEKSNQLLEVIIQVLSGTPIAEAGNGSPSALQTALKTAVSGKSLGDFSNIENTKVLHG